MTLKRLLWIVGGNILIAGIFLQKYSTYLYLRGRVPNACNGTVMHALHDLVTGFQSNDSWLPMLTALKSLGVSGGVYQSVFFDQNIKFQYPLTSLLPLWMLQQAGMPDLQLLPFLNFLSVLAVGVAVVFAVLIAFRSADPTRMMREKHSGWLLGAISVLVSVTFYPLIKSYALGQLQVFLNCLFCIAFFCWLTGRERAAGALVGVIALAKPQYVLILLWGAARNRWGFVRAGALCAASGAALSIVLFGLGNNLQYFRVLSFLSKHGEAFYPNQTFNGLLNRLLGNGDNILFPIHGFPPYRPVIYGLTVITSVLLLFWAVPLKMQAGGENRILDLSLIAIAATAASPIGWEHHYGIVLPVLIWQIARYVPGGGLSKWRSAALVLSYLLISDDWRMTNLLAPFPPWNILQSYLFLGVLVLIGVLKSEMATREADDASYRMGEAPVAGARL